MRLRSARTTTAPTATAPRLRPEAVLAECPKALPGDLLRAIHDRAIAAYRERRWPYATVAPELRTAVPNYTESVTRIPLRYFRSLRVEPYRRFFDYAFTIRGVFHRIVVRQQFYMETEYALLREETADAPKTIGGWFPFQRYFAVVGHAWHNYRDGDKQRVRITLTETNTAPTREAVYALAVVMRRYIGDRWLTPRQRVNFVTAEGAKTFKSLRRFLYEAFPQTLARRRKR